MSVRYDFRELNEVPFTQVIERLGGVVRRSGSTLLTTCPWHDDKHPSLVIYEGTKGNRAKCFACGKSASVLDYVMEVGNMTLSEAAEWVGIHFGLRPEVGPKRARPYETSRALRSGTGVPTKRYATKRPKSYEVLMLLNTTLRNANAKKTEEGSYYAFDSGFMDRYVGAGNSFCRCLREVVGAEVVELVTMLYKLGTYTELGREDDVMFPSIDKDGVLRNVKVQSYCTDRQSEGFFHCDKKHIFWLGDILKKRGEVPHDARFRNSCLFGEHLLKDAPDDTVVLVESPKNAVVGACRFPTMIWVATGNKGNLTREALECLRGRNVIVIPDNDAIEDWKTKLATMEDIANFVVSSFCDVQKICGEKADVADWMMINTA